METETTNAAAAASGPDLETVRSIARRFFDPDEAAPEWKRRIHARDGLLAATDGRRIIQVFDPSIKAEKGSNEKMLDFVPPPAENGLVAAGPEWIHGELRRLLNLATERARARLEEARRKFRERVDVTTCICPKCQAELVYDEDFGLFGRKEYEENFVPDEEGTFGDVLVCVPGIRPLRLSLALLEECYAADRQLGGSDTLAVSADHICFMKTPFRIGRFWRIALIGKVRSPAPVDLVLDFDRPQFAIARQKANLPTPPASPAPSE